MNKTLLIVIGIIVVIAGGTGFLLLTNDDATSTNSSSNSPVEAPATTTTETTTTSASSYQEYSPEAVANTSGTKILFFHANWCPQCKKLEADIKQTSLPSDVTVFEVDYDTSQDLKQKYGVTLQTTLVKVDDSGEIVSKFIAYDDPSWEAVANNLL